MISERNQKEVIIKLPTSVNIGDLQGYIEYSHYNKVTSKYKAPREEINKLAVDINENWWLANKMLITNRL